MQTNDQTAILLFSRSSRQEALHKQLAGSRSYEVSKTLLRHVMREARKTGLPISTCFSAQQEGNTFGERLANATETVFSQGYSRIIIIGSDSPGIDASLLQRAHQRLEAQTVVFGPAQDGGLYLIGLSASMYDRDSFVDLPWETEYLHRSFVTQWHLAGVNTYCLPTLVDLDTAQHFATWYSTIHKGWLQLELSRFIPDDSGVHKLFRYLAPAFRQNLLACSPRRGPPPFFVQ
ncbi:MAG: DUF2064 domain-containing protein [Bacteroidota bacterium]